MLTGSSKARNKIYYRHTGYPGGLKETTAKKLLVDGKADRIVRNAVKGMLSKNILGRNQIRKLYVYNGTDHPHAGQQPQLYDFGAENRKNRG